MSRPRVIGVPGPLHRVSRRARDDQILDWAIATVEAQRGAATFVGLGRTEKRILQQIESGLPSAYSAYLIRFESGSPPARYRQRRREMRLRVQRNDLGEANVEVPRYPQG